MLVTRRSRVLTTGLALLGLTAGLSACGSTGDDGSMTGGASSMTGGTSSTGGSSSTGGISATGGLSSTGGTESTGGTGSGGSSSTGGASSTGGSSTTGGKSSTGGTSATGGGGGSSDGTCTEGESNCFSFFVTGRARLFKLAEDFNGSTKGWGGDFRYGTGDGLQGADKICTEIAEQSLPGNGKTWRAFLSTSKVNAIDRVGAGPWHDRLNRLMARNVTELVATRPGGITNAMILNNLPNEDGTPMHNEEAGCSNLNSCADNHDTLTGSDSDGKFCTPTTCSGGPGGGMGGPGGGATLTDYTCSDWTLGTSTAGIAPRCGHTWSAGMGGGSTARQDDWISILTENGCAPGFNLVQNGGPNPTGNGSVGDGGGFGAFYCLAAQ